MSIPCDIVLLPSKKLSDTAVEASKAISHFDTFFTLEIGKFQPHMSLYMFQLDEAAIRDVELLLNDIAQLTPVIPAAATEYSLGQGFAVGYVDPEYKVTDEMLRLQRAVIEAINPLRVGMRESDIAKMQDAEGLKLENLQKYGYPAIGDLFRPHLTLTRLKGYDPAVLESLPKDISTFSGIFDKIGLFEMGPNGTCIRELSTFSLQNVS